MTDRNVKKVKQKLGELLLDIQLGEAPEYGEGGEEVMDAALELFAEKGFAATSVREIVERAGVTKPALYYHFENKEGLLRAIIGRALREYGLRVERALGEATDGRDALVKFLETAFEMASRRPALVAVMYQAFLGPQAESGGVDVTEFAERNQDLVFSVIERAVREGLIKEERADLAGMLLSGLLSIHLMAHMKDGIELNRAAAVRAVDCYLYGVAEPAG